MQFQQIDELEVQIANEIARFEMRHHPVEFPPLPELPARRYVSNEFFDLEQKHVWSKCWLFAGHSDEVLENGSYKLWRDAGAPIIIVRGNDGVLRGFYNTCRHRGGPLVRQEKGEAASFLCKYHCWNFDLQGNLKFVPDAHEFPGLDKADKGLIPVRVEQWGNWIFVNLDMEAAPIAEYFCAVMPDMADYKPNELKLVSLHSFDVACNWKVAMDAFQEVYHLKHIHPETVDKMLDHRGAVMTLFRNGHSRMVVPKRALDAGGVDSPMRSPGKEPTAEHKITRETSRSYNLFPNIVAPTGEFEWPFLVFWPTSVNSCRMDVWWWGQPDDCDPSSEEWQMRVAAFDAVLAEDMENLAWIQESLETPGFTSVPLGYQERRIYNFHENLDRVVGLENVPPDAAVTQILACFLVS